MKFAILAAGEGSRLFREGVGVPKPLVRVGGETLIGRLLRIFHQQGAEETVVIVNQLHPETEAYVRSLMAKGQYGPIRLVVKTTPSSMHSFFELSAFLTDAPFCLTTVDTIFKEEEFAAFIEHFKKSEADGCMAVTDFIDDEKPLYVQTDEQLDIVNFLDRTNGECRYISGGIYCLRKPAIGVLKKAIDEGMSRMRNYQRQLIAEGLRLKAYPFSKIIDVDHAEDIVKAEAFVQA